MKEYIAKRVFLIFPTLLGIITINFFLVQAAPGGPVETMIARLSGTEVSAVDRATGTQETSGPSDTEEALGESSSPYKGADGIPPEVIQEIERLYNFDKPLFTRYLLMLRDFSCFDFGESFFRDKRVVDLIKEKLPVSISLGVWSTVLIYLISIPLGIAKAVRHGSRFDLWSSLAVIVGDAVPMFLFAIVLIIFLAGGNYLTLFPLRGLVSDNIAQLSTWGKILDYLWHMVLPITTMVIGGFASLTMLTKNAFLDEISAQYVTTARAKGITEKRILYGHIFRNAMLIVISGFPAAFISMFFTGSLMTEVIFSLDGMGLMGFEAAMGRDYPVMFATLYIFTLMGLALSIVSDLTYTLVDPRISFGSSGS
ncbi:microcin C ABC transporter permease YejB [Desulfoluna butyratoxydans]|uniref:Binding-protein-dependent transport system inner membrane component n=1 Tax=Desulfoluna butyratoxydans TaxID=231438 RepID=A0A4U8YRA3_9BACT|nr:microcin C ABC transporter permease YejB [Desulfoluna butyratoxydans]VFQ46254.1 binding-protein-dependent transport system inner membrane component [Desulfoluna butyratoxydans]